MKIIHLTDLHGADFLLPEISNSLRKADLVVISGDITHFGNALQSKKIIDYILPFNENIFAVSGNCDHPDVELFLLGSDIGIHRKIKSSGNLVFTGLGGSLFCPGTTPNEYSEEEASAWLNEMADQIGSEARIVLVSHQPPFGTINDQVDGGEHVGSRSVLDFINRTNPLLCLTGHIHEGIGTDLVNNCLIVNPGPFRKGRFAEIEITDEFSVNTTLKRITA